MKVRTVQHQKGDGHPDLMFWCPACLCGHGVWTGGNSSASGGEWTFNGNFEKPTFRPSLLITQKVWVPPVTAENMEQFNKNPWPQKEVERRCHSVVTDGMIAYCKDCTHELAGKTVPMEDF